MKFPMVVVALLGSMSAECATYRVELNHKAYEAQFLAASGCSGISGNNRHCVFELNSEPQSVWVKVIELDRTKPREWSPDVDSWSLGFVKVPRDTAPLEVVKFVVEGQK